MSPVSMRYGVRPLFMALTLLCAAALSFALAIPSASAQEILGPEALKKEDRDLDEVTASGFIEIAVYRDFPPYSFEDADGNPAGIDIDVGKLIAAKLGVEPHWFWVNPDENLEADLRNAIWRGSLFDGTRADLMLRVPYDSEYAHAIDGYGLPKHEHVAFFGPYHQESWAIARDLKKTGEVRNLAIFAYEKVGVEIASLPDTMLLSAFNGRLRSNVTHYGKIFEALDGLRAGEVAAVVGMRSQIEYGLREVPGSFDVDTDGLEQLTKLGWDIGAAVRENHRQLANEVDYILEQAVRSGEIKEIFEHYAVTFDQPSVYDVSE